jgi:flagellin-like protein
MMNKKAVSPLIATVLLIAFTVALGAIVMNWGESFVRKTQDTASSASEGKIECTMAVDFEVMNSQYTENSTSISDDQGGLSLLVRNGGDEKISQFVAQVFTNTTRGARGVYSGPILESLDVRTINIPVNFTEDYSDGLNNTFSQITEIRLIPKIDTGALTGPVSCSNRYFIITKDKLVVKDN